MTKTILFPTDYSEASNSALRYAVSLAQQADAMLLVVHVELSSTPPLGTAAPPGTRRAEEEAGLVTLLTTISAADNKPVRHEFRRLRGDAATEIMRLAEREQVELIVMATAGRTGWRRLLMGSVAETLLREAPCPVLCLKQPLASARPVGAGSAAAETRASAGGDAAVVFRPEEEGWTEAGGSPAMALLRRAIEARATDVHIDPQRDDGDDDGDMVVRFRIDGRLEPYCRLSRDVAHPLVTQLKIMAEVDIADPFHPKEGRISLPGPLGNHEVRITSVPVLGGESIALRLLNRQNLLRPLDGLGLSSDSLTRMHEMLKLGEGVVLVTGPAGSGKTTTAYSMVHAMDDSHRNIVTIEDPVEYHIPGFRQMMADPRHGVTMTSGLRTMLRMDPDVVLVGEIRDAETAEIAMRAASSGKYVFTTLHTRDVASTVTALRDLHIDNRSLAGNLTGIISQRLVRRLCRHCRGQTAIDAAQRQTFRDEGLDPPDSLPAQAGCEQCRQSGYHERIGIFEVVVPDRALREAIEGGAAEDELRDLLRSGGTRSLLADALEKVRDGITTLDEARAMTWVSFPA